MDRDAILSLLPELATMREVGAADFQVWGQAAFLRQQDHGARVLLPFAELAGDVYRVRDERMPALEEKMAPLRRRAARLGLPVPEVEVVAVEHLPAVAVFRDQQGAPCFSITDDVRTFHVLRPSREPVRLAGWTFAATIDHAEDGNVLRTSPGLVGNLPLSYRTDPPTCDHCKARRWRSATYVVRSDDGAFARVGSTCLKSYLGDATATQIVAWAEIEQALQDSLVDDWSEGGAIGYAPRAVDPVAFLSAVALVIQRNGWLSRRVARQTDREATADTAWSLLFPPKGTQLKLTRRDITDAHREDADAALGWAQEIASDVESDYLYNIRTVAHRGA